MGEIPSITNDNGRNRNDRNREDDASNKPKSKYTNKESVNGVDVEVNWDADKNSYVLIFNQTEDSPYTEKGNTETIPLSEDQECAEKMFAYAAYLANNGLSPAGIKSEIIEKVNDVTVKISWNSEKKCYSITCTQEENKGEWVKKGDSFSVDLDDNVRHTKNWLLYASEEIKKNSLTAIKIKGKIRKDFDETKDTKVPPEFIQDNPEVFKVGDYQENGHDFYVKWHKGFQEYCMMFPNVNTGTSDLTLLKLGKNRSRAGNYLNIAKEYVLLNDFNDKDIYSSIEKILNRQ